MSSSHSLFSNFSPSYSSISSHLSSFLYSLVSSQCRLLILLILGLPVLSYSLLFSLSSPLYSTLDSPLYYPLSVCPFSVLSSTSSPLSSLLYLPPLFFLFILLDLLRFHFVASLLLRCVSGFVQTASIQCFFYHLLAITYQALFCAILFRYFFIQNSWPEIRPNSQRIPGAYTLRE